MHECDNILIICSRYMLQEQLKTYFTACFICGIRYLQIEIMEQVKIM